MYAARVSFIAPYLQRDVLVWVPFEYAESCEWEFIEAL